MHRAVPVIAATAGGLALLANFHTTGTTTATVVGGTTIPATDPTTASITGAGSTAPTTTMSPSGTRTVDGPVVPNEYGNVQVRVTLNGSKIVDVEALQLPSHKRRSQQISDYAGPQLRTEVLQAQSANIDLVSGASYTSDSYAQSVQGALDNAGR
jgi:uncharacterized protein with FMN-binding domain